MNTNMKRALILFVGLSMAAAGAFAQENPPGTASRKSNN